jgi:argininosuccinate synthase
MDTIVLAYSGGLDSSVALAWLTERYRAKVVAVTMDLGQGRDLADVRERALAIGAVRAHVLDLREEFAKHFVLPALQASARHGGRDVLSTALGRPLIAKHLLEIARIEGAVAVAHASTGTPTGPARLDVLLAARNPSVTVLAPAREWGFTRVEQIEYARQHGIPVAATSGPTPGADTNIWGRSIRGVADDLWQEGLSELFLLTKAAAETPDAAATVELEFATGVPVGINGVALPLVELFSSLDTIAGAHGVGRIETMRSDAGVATREITEAPAAFVLHMAHDALQRVVTPDDLYELTSELGRKYADLVYSGRWFMPTREAIEALVKHVQAKVTGVVRLKFFKGDCRVVGLMSPFIVQGSAASEQAAAEAVHAAEGVLKISI